MNTSSMDRSIRYPAFQSSRTSLSASLSTGCSPGRLSHQAYRACPASSSDRPLRLMEERDSFIRFVLVAASIAKPRFRAPEFVHGPLSTGGPGSSRLQRIRDIPVFEKDRSRFPPPRRTSCRENTRHNLKTSFQTWKWKFWRNCRHTREAASRIPVPHF